MIEALHQFHFLQPLWLLGLLALPLTVPFARRDPGRQALSRLVDPELLSHLLRGQAGHRAWPVGLAATAWAVSMLALAGPTWSRVNEPLFADRAAQVVAISLSQHMTVRDIAPSRLERARYKAQDLFDANSRGLNGLIAYAGEAFTVAPLTTDARSLRDLLAALAPDIMPVDGNDASQAIERGMDMIAKAKTGGGSLVLITDQADSAALAAAGRARAAGVMVSVLGVGTLQGGAMAQADGGFVRDPQGDMDLAKRDDAQLGALAAAGGGRYEAMTEGDADIRALSTELKSGTPLLAQGISGDDWQDRGPWLLWLLLPIAAALFRRGWVMVVPLLCLPWLPGKAHASTWDDLWRRADQQAAQALSKGQAAQAMQLANDPAWRGTAAYRAGKYSDAATAWKSAPGADAQYNVGNALAREGKYREALDAYDRALKLDPTSADAKANRDAVDAWLRKQEQQQAAQQNKDHPAKTKPNDNGKQQGQPGSQQQDKSASSDAGQGQQQGQARPDQGQAAEHGGTSGKQPEDRPAMDHAAEGEAKPETAEEKAAEQVRQQQAREALKAQMDKSLQGGQGKPGTPPSHELGAVAADDPQAKLPDNLRRAMQRVPDDPGALLRRKFELEYRERHGASTGDDRP
ncbi:MAG TPA: tetratricopeptide repeat protein [Dyella sp.]|uniref:tetratricopeptide repeat protein n=1 Tax=Dyella sp. TaxID=1869338 RepID=UPI002F92259A